MGENVLAVIPARGGSKGIPRKNIVELHGKPLIAYTIECALRAGCFDRVIVSTDDDEIRQVSLEWGAEAPFIRPSELATDRAGAISTIQHAVRESQAIYGRQFDIIAMLQPTSPLKTDDDIRGAIARLKLDPKADGIISVVDVGAHHPARMKYLDGDLLVDPPFAEEYENQPRQELTPMYIRNGAIYACRRSVLMEKSSFKGEYCLAWIMPAERSANIDTGEDLELVRSLLDRKE